MPFNLNGSDLTGLSVNTSKLDQYKSTSSNKAASGSGVVMSNFIAHSPPVTRHPSVVP